MKKLFLRFVMAATLIAPVVFTSCSDDDDDKGGDGVTETFTVENGEMMGRLKSAYTLDADVELVGPVIVESGASLTIPAGRTIKAKGGFSCYILVLQGGKIFVNGTAEAPVTMTSGAMKDNAPNPKAMDWGGLIINGRAPLADGITRSTEINTNYPYGGNDANDNSGVIKYLKLEYTGAKNGNDVEHNGLTLNAVGRATVIENIFIPYSGDDGIEFFGGSVSVKNLLVVNSDDDMFDVTDGWNGTLENAYGIWKDGFSSAESDPSGVEADGNMDGKFDKAPNMSNFTIRNMTIENNGVLMNNVLKVRRGATAHIINAVVKGSGTVKPTGYVVDMTDGAGNGNTASEISITNAMTNSVIPTNFGTDLYPNVTVNPTPANTGCENPATLFSWTGYQF
ncbi:MAG: hypothetical protein LBR81_01715 [Prevotellaceae bacterium]|jgi:hypothetical protein|nr:hypothetical protein [Prevotellaceae bacterium]